MDRVARWIPVAFTALFFVSPVFGGCGGCGGGWTDINAWGIKPNIGIDAGVKNQSFNSGFGEEHFRQDYPETNLYFGMKFHPYVGIEGGYQYMYRLQREQYYPIGSSVLGSSNAFPGALEQRTFISNVNGQGWNLSLLGFWPICPRTKTELMAAVGLVWQKLYYSTVAITDNAPATPLAMWESSDRTLFRVGLGVRQMITKHFGSRFQVFWEDTSKLSASFPVPVGQGGRSFPTTEADSYTAKPRDNYSFLFGFFFQVT